MGVAFPTWAADARAPLRLPSKVRVALIGWEGHVGELLSHLPQLPDVTVTAVAVNNEPSGARLRQNKALTGARFYGGADELLAREKVDVAVVANSNGERAAVVKACLERRLPTIAEKPLALTWKDLRAIQALRDRHRVPLSLLLPMRFEPAFAQLRQVVASGRVGEVVQIDAQKSYRAGDRPRWMRERDTYGGTFAWIGIHMIDLMRFTSGRDLVEVTARENQVGTFPNIGQMENVNAALYRLDNGGLATLRMDYLRPETAPTHEDDRLRLAGSEGVVEFQAATGVRLLRRGGPPEVLTPPPHDKFVVVEFLRSLYLGGEPPVSVADVDRVNAVTLWTQEAARQGKTVLCPKG